MTQQRYRLLLIGLGAVFIAVVALAVAINPRTGPVELPAPIEDLDPGPNEFMLRQGILSIDLPVNYELRLFIDDAPIPQAEIGHVEGTGVWRWAPQEDGVLQGWSAGNYVARITWDTISGLPDPGGYTWTFRVQ